MVNGMGNGILKIPASEELIRQVEQLAKKERRTKSGLLREMVRVYQKNRGNLRWVERLIAETKAEQAAQPMSPDEIIEESRRLARAGSMRRLRRSRSA
jgi:hypothetical protein